MKELGALAERFFHLQRAACAAAFVRAPGMWTNVPLVNSSKSDRRRKRNLRLSDKMQTCSREPSKSHHKRKNKAHHEYHDASFLRKDFFVQLLGGADAATEDVVSESLEKSEHRQTGLP